MARVLIDGRWYYTKRGGKLAEVVSDGNSADHFEDGLVRTLDRDKVGFLNRELERVIEPRFDWAMPFEDGFALVCLDCRLGPRDDEGHRRLIGGRWGYIDRKGDAVVPIQYSFDEVHLHRPALRVDHVE